MVRPKNASSKKQKNRGVDFKKIKHKMGRKLPPKNNATNTQVKSKAIVIPEQSVASERGGLAVSRKGLTLKELLQKTSHHNAKVRKDALYGIKDLSIRYESELLSHKLVIMEKLCERISDDDKVVRETLYQLLESVIFPCFKEDMPGHIISLMMAYIFNTMTHITNDIRIMAFMFFNLVVEHYPSSFFSYADKVLQNYEDILRNTMKYIQDKGRFKVVLDGLVCCLSLLDCDTRKSNQSLEQISNIRRALHAFEPELPKEETGTSITNNLEDLFPVLINIFQELFPLVCKMPTVETHSFDCMLSVLQSIDHIVKFFACGLDKPHTSNGGFMHKGPSLPTWGESSIPVLLKKLFESFPLSRICHSKEKENRMCYVLNIRIAKIFLHLNEWIGCPAIHMDKFLAFIENVLSWQEIWMLSEVHIVSLLQFIPRLVCQVPNNWKFRLLEAFTKAFKSSDPESTLKLACLSVIEEMLLPPQRHDTQFLDDHNQDMMGYWATMMWELPNLLSKLAVRNPSTSRVVLHLQLRLGQCALTNSPLSTEYDNMQRELIEIFIEYFKERKFAKDCKELAICCLYYFSRLSSPVLESLACCLCQDLEPYVIFRVIEVLDSAYKAGHVQITDQISFLVTLIARFKVHPGKVCYRAENHGNISNRATFKAIMNTVYSCLSQMGDGALILKILLKTILNEMSLRPPLDNMRAMLRMVVMLDSKLTIPEEYMSTMSYYLFGYLVDAAVYIPENIDETADSGWTLIFQYYVQPALIMFERSNRLLSLVLELLVSLIKEHDSTCPSHDNKYVCQLPSRVHAVAFVLIFMHKDAKVHRSLSSCKETIKSILQNILSLQASNEINLTILERQKVQFAFEQLKVETGRIHLWDADDFKGSL